MFASLRSLLVLPLCLVVAVIGLLLPPAPAAYARDSREVTPAPVASADYGLGAALACLETGRFVPVPAPQARDRNGAVRYVCRDQSGFLSQEPPYPVVACVGPMACSPTGENEGDRPGRRRLGFPFPQAVLRGG